jgi:hypothetical protein
MSVQVLPGNIMARVEVWSCAPASGANQRTATANLTALFTLLLLPPHIGVVPAAPDASTNSGHIGLFSKALRTASKLRLCRLHHRNDVVAARWLEVSCGSAEARGFAEVYGIPQHRYAKGSCDRTGAVGSSRRQSPRYPQTAQTREDSQALSQNQALVSRRNQDAVSHLALSLPLLNEQE